MEHSAELYGFLFSMNRRRRSAAILRIMDMCDVSIHTVRNWYRGKCDIKLLYMKAINKGFKQAIFNL